MALLKKKKGQNRNSAPCKIQYPMKNQDENRTQDLHLQQRNLKFVEMLITKAFY
jgi:hypothetical protein